MTAPGRFLIATWDGGGNTPSAFHLGSRLARRGHRVRMLGWESMAARAAGAGIEFTAYPSAPPWPAGLTQDDGWQDRMEPLLHGRAIREDILTEADTFAPDVLVLDCMLGAGFAAARQLRLPTAVLVHVLYAPFVHGWGDMVMHTSVAGLLAEADRVLALTPPGLDEPALLPANTSYVGPILPPDHRLDRLQPADVELIEQPGDPWILLSLSTTLQRQADALPAMLAAAALLPVRVLLTLGGVVPIDAVDPPPNVTVREFVPHELVLPHMAAVVSHGGMSTITTALGAGVPLVCIPQGREQPLNASRVAACGIGRVLAPDASAAEIAGAVEATLTNTHMRRSARRFAELIDGLGRGAAATDHIARLHSPHQPHARRPAPATSVPAATQSERPVRVQRALP